MNPTQTQLDPQIMALTKAIRSVENPSGDPNKMGASGEWGNYQFTKDTWNAMAPKYGVASKWGEASPEDQNKVAYSQVADWKNKGFNVGQVASMWNAGPGKPNAYIEGNAGVNSKGVGFDTAAYAAKVASAYQQFKQENAPSTGIIPVANAAEPGAQPVQSPSVGGFIQNAAQSAGNVVGGLAQAAMHPIDTLSNIAGMAAGGFEKLGGIQNDDTQKFDALTGYLKQRYGGDSLSEVLNHVGHTAYTDPVGAALDLSTVLDGVGAAVGAIGKTSKIAEISKAAEMLKSASETINPIAAGAKMAKPIVNTGIAATRSLASKVFSLSDPQSITAVLENGPEFSKGAMAETNRLGLAEDFGQALDQLHESVQEGGRAYGGISKGTIPVAVPENWISDVLSKGSSAEEAGGKVIPFKLTLTPDETGRLIVGADTTSFTRDPKDLAAIQNFVDNWGNKTELTPQEFLNMRSDLAKISKFGREVGKNNAAELVGRALRADANKMMRPNIPGLKNLDETQAPIIQQYNQAKKDFLTAGANGEYEFKPNAINKIANATGKGKDLLLQRMEQLSPGITKRIQILKAVEDWESAGKAKVGSYARGILEGGGLVTGNIHMIAAAILTSPQVALAILRGLGWSAEKMKPLIDLLKKIVNTRTLKYGAQAGKISNQTAGQPTLVSPTQSAPK